MSTSNQEQGDQYERGRDDQLAECCEKLQRRYAHLGTRGEGLGVWLRNECRPPKRDLKAELLALLNTCSGDPRCADVRQRVEALPAGLLDQTLKQED